MIFVGSHSDRFFSGSETGLLAQFRGQYLWLFLIAHFHKAALLSMADELAVAMTSAPRVDVRRTLRRREFRQLDAHQENPGRRQKAPDTQGLMCIKERARWGSNNVPMTSTRHR